MENLTTNHILVGLGGTGGKILKAFKMRMFEEFPEFHRFVAEYAGIWCSSALVDFYKSLNDVEIKFSDII